MNSTTRPEPRRPASKRDVVRLSRERDVRFVRLVFADIFGVSKNVSIPASELEAALAGRVTFDGGWIYGSAVLKVLRKGRVSRDMVHPRLLDWLDRLELTPRPEPTRKWHVRALRAGGRWTYRRLLFPALFLLFAGWMLAYTYVPLMIAALYHGRNLGTAVGVVVGVGGLVALAVGPALGALAN